MKSWRSHNSTEESNDSYEAFQSDSFQTQSHNNLIFMMSLLGFDVNKAGMCYGFALTASHYHSKGKLKEFDSIIQDLLKIYHESFKNGLSNRDEYIKEKIVQLNEHLKKSGSDSVHDLFTHVVKFHHSQNEADAMFLPTVDGIYNQTEIMEYLQSLNNIYYDECEHDNLNPFSLSLILCSHQHALSLIFEDNNVLVRDINYPEKQYFEDIEQIFALALNQNESNSLLVSTKFYIPEGGHHNERTVNCFNNWQSSNEFKSLHEMNIDRISRVGKDGNSLLSDAISNNQLELAKQIVRSIENTNDIDQSIFARALFVSMLDDHHDMVDFFLDHPLFNINIPASSLAHGYSLTPLCLSIIFGNDTITEKMIKLDADINSTNSNRISNSFFDGRIINKKENIIAFLQNAAGLNYDSNSIISSLTALHLSALFGNEKITQLLLKRGAKITLCDGGICADDFAKCMGHNELALSILNKCKQDTIKEMASLDIPMEAIAIINNQQSAKDCLNIMSCLDRLKKLKDHINSTPLLTELFSERLKQIDTFVHDGMRTTDFNSQISAINTMTRNLSNRINLINSIAMDQSNDNDEFTASRHDALLRIQKKIAINEKNDDVQYLNDIFKGINNMAKIVKSTELTRFTPYVSHQDWHDLVKDCYNKSGLADDNGYAILTQKLKYFKEFYGSTYGLGLKKPINSISNISIKNALIKDITVTDEVTQSLRKKE